MRLNPDPRLLLLRGDKPQSLATEVRGSIAHRYRLASSFLGEGGRRSEGVSISAAAY